MSRADLNYDQGNIKNVHYGDVLIKFGEYIDVASAELPYINDNSIESKFAKSLLEDGDIIIADTAEDETVGKCCEITNSEGMKLLSGLHTIAVRPQQKYASKFLGYYLNSNAYHSQLLPLMQGIKVTSISKGALQDTVLTVPTSIDEQRKIGECLSNIDDAITLHQCMHYPHQICRRRYESISFYRHNTTAWEQRKLGDVFEEYSEKNHEELPPLTIIQGKGTILREESDRNLQYDKNSLSGYKLVHKDDFIVHLRSFEGGLEKANSDGIVSPAYHMFHGNSTDSRFYYPFFRSRQFISVLLKPHIYGIRDGKSIDIAGMKTIMIPVPSYEEQVKIGDLIESLDTAITLHQRNNSQ